MQNIIIKDKTVMQLTLPWLLALQSSILASDSGVLLGLGRYPNFLVDMLSHILSHPETLRPL